MKQESRTSEFFHRYLSYIIPIVLLCGLGALLIPVYPGGGSGSPGSSCISNLKQLGLATAMYASDNNDAIPINYSFDGVESQTKYMEAIFPYTKNKQILLCPQEQRNIIEMGTTPTEEGIPGTMDYVHCLSLRGVIPNFSENKRFLNLSKLSDQSKVPYLRDPIRGYGTAKDNQDNGFLSPHGGGFVTVYLDMHAKYIKAPNINSDL
ncbi:MAG: hypothetical protein WCI55_16375 [Armatimonadota bacterium]